MNQCYSYNLLDRKYSSYYRSPEVGLFRKAINYHLPRNQLERNYSTMLGDYPHCCYIHQPYRLNAYHRLNLHKRTFHYYRKESKNVYTPDTIIATTSLQGKSTMRVVTIQSEQEVTSYQVTFQVFQRYPMDYCYQYLWAFNSDSILSV